MNQRERKEAGDLAGRPFFTSKATLKQLVHQEFENLAVKRKQDRMH
jgi:hypothetical protein